VSTAVVLTLAHAPDHVLVADCIAADRFASCGSKEIAELPVLHGGRPARLGRPLVSPIRRRIGCPREMPLDSVEEW